MKRLPHLGLVILLGFAAAPLAPAARFLPDGALDLAQVIPPPPAADSLVTRAEIETVLQFQDLRTPELAARAHAVEHETIDSFGADVLGPWFKPAALPKTAALFTAVREDFIAVNRASKALWPRKRPPFADPRVKPCVEFSDSGSYPSGHGIQSAMWAVLFAELLPEKAAAFQQRALETRRMKLFTGVHYPSDLEAGRVLGEALARRLLQEAAVQELVDASREELGVTQRVDPRE